MKLYIIPGACSLAVHIALREANIPFDLAQVDFQTGKVDDGADYRSINPKGYVPALQLDDGQVLTETAALLQYVSDLNSQAELAPPAGSLERYRLLEWLAFINSEIHKGFSPLFAAEAGEEIKDYARQRLAKRLDYLQEVLRRPYLLGDRFTVADAYLFTVLGWIPEAGMDSTQWAKLEHYRARIAQRPQVAAALQAEA
jgi:glutathione S-transferase